MNLFKLGGFLQSCGCQEFDETNLCSMEWI